MKTQTNARSEEFALSYDENLLDAVNAFLCSDRRSLEEIGRSGRLAPYEALQMTQIAHAHKVSPAEVRSRVLEFAKAGI